jgi:hypothetical protein
MGSREGGRGWIKETYEEPMPVAIMYQLRTKLETSWHYSTIPALVSCTDVFTFQKGKGKVVPVLFLTQHHAKKAYWGSGCIASRIL